MVIELLRCYHKTVGNMEMQMEILMALAMALVLAVVLSFTLLNMLIQCESWDDPGCLTPVGFSEQVSQ